LQNSQQRELYNSQNIVMEKITTLFRSKFGISPINLGLLAGLLLMICYFINPYSLSDTTSATYTSAVDHLIFAGEQLVIIATALTAMALYLGISWIFGLTGAMILILWLVDCSSLLMHKMQVSLTFSWPLIPMAAVALLISATVVKSDQVIEAE